MLRNLLGITDPAELDRAERLLVVQRTLEGPPIGHFDLAHLQAVHRHLFQDVYEWAGKLRTVEINKGGTQFQASPYLETGMADIHRRLVASGFLKGRTPDDFAREAATIIADVNFVHPFREGNGRAQLEYLRQLAQRAGHDLNPDKLHPAEWQNASRLSADGDYSAMADAILNQSMRPSSMRAKLAEQPRLRGIPRDGGRPI